MLAQCFSFGPFTLLPNQERLLRYDAPVRLGSRALAILSVLVEHAGELISKQDLMSRVWPDTFVDESNLKVNIAALRKALDEDNAGQSHIVNVSGRGYRFIAPVSAIGSENLLASRRRASNLPHSIKEIVGRGEAIRQIIAQLSQSRLVTIVGSGGVGKTTVATGVADTLLQTYKDGASFVDLSSLSDLSSVPHAISAALGLPIATGKANDELISYLQNRELLLVVDTCEHVLSSAAECVERIRSCCPQVHILATSREPIGAKGERWYRLPPLDVPPANSDPFVDAIRTFPAVDLFLKCAAEASGDLTINDSQGLIIAELCRQLDGIPLAIELAAVRARLLGWESLPSVAADQFLYFYQSRRTGPRRHQSLAAAYEWGWDLLPENERSAFLRLSLLHGTFDLETAVSVTSGGLMSPAEATACIANLVSKSLLERVDGCASKFRLLSLVRYFASKKLAALDLAPKNVTGRSVCSASRTAFPKGNAGDSPNGANRSGAANAHTLAAAISQ